MDAGTLVLLHSPLVGVESWGALPEALARGGVGAVAVPVVGDDRPPFAERYVDGAVAGLPGDGATRLELLAAEDPEMAAGFRAELERGGRFPTWGDADLATLVPDPAARAALIGSLRPRDLAFFTEPLPAAPGWPDAPCGFLRLSPAYDTWAVAAAARGWPAATLDAGHFHPLADPGAVADALLGLLARL